MMHPQMHQQMMGPPGYPNFYPGNPMMSPQYGAPMIQGGGGMYMNPMMQPTPPGYFMPPQGPFQQPYNYPQQFFNHPQAMMQPQQFNQPQAIMGGPPHNRNTMPVNASEPVVEYLNDDAKEESATSESEARTAAHVTMEMVRLLCQRLRLGSSGLFPCDPPQTAQTALHAAAWRCAEGHCAPVGRYLIRMCGMDVNVLDSTGMMPLHVAAERGSLEAA
ncbi:unnamed protein product, partial [Amoebophrya sp. A25]|eukprot:GSA25T00014179001.1